MPEPFYFICYSRADGEDLAFQLGDRLAAGPPSIPVWLDRRRLQPGIDWDEQIIEALRGCTAVLYVMTQDSVSSNSECKKEWTRALKYNKPIIPLLFDKSAELPFRLEPRQYIDFTAGFDAGLAQLREHVRWRATPEGVLHTLRERLEDTRRELARADPADKARGIEEIPRSKGRSNSTNTRWASIRRHIASPGSIARENKTMPEPFYFISYSPVDGDDIALHLDDKLMGGSPSIPTWIDRRKLKPGIDRYKQIGEALRDCAALLLVLTKDSADPDCDCTQEWTRAAKVQETNHPVAF